MEEENYDEKFEVRDLRVKEKFQIDDKFLNGYAKIVGIYATGIYISLCRRADKEQKCFPSQKRIAEELSISEPTVNEYLKVLEYFKIIKKERLGKKLNNRYFLIDKKYWRKDFDVILNELSSSELKEFNITTKRVLVHNLKSFSSIVRKHNSKETHINNTLSKDKGGNSSEYGNPSINKVISHLKEKFDLKELDGSQKQNRQYSYLLLKKIGGEQNLDGLLALIDFASKDKWWQDKITSTKDLYYNIVKIYQAIKNKGRKIGYEDINYENNKNI